MHMDTLSAAWLRDRFAVLSECSQGAALGISSDDSIDGAALIEAAVLVPLVWRETGMTVLLTQRTAHLRDHAGQISFPGGRREDFDRFPIETALREAKEEIGLSPSQVEVLGFLPEYRTVTGFNIIPVVGLIFPPLNLHLDDFEVAEAFEVPLGFLLDPANVQRHQVEYSGHKRDYFAMPWGGYFIWGATAGMLVSLRHVLFPGTPTDDEFPVTGS